MSPLLKKHASLLALLAVLFAAAAAPYMLPDDPDGAVFRSGILGALLLAADFFPARAALLRAACSREGRRALTGGLLWGFLFACALSLGAELGFYGGLLPGLGSAVRRAAVPVLAAPLLGGVAARVLSASPEGSAQSSRARRVPWWAFAALLLVCWLPVWLASFPAMINCDFLAEFEQQLSGRYGAMHPLLYSLAQNFVIRAGQRLHSRTFGLALATFARMLALAGALGYACRFAQERGAPRAAVGLLFALFALHPVFSVMAVSTSKDAPFAAAFTVLSLLSWRAAEDPRAFFASRSRLAAFLLAAVLTAHLRKNGVFALAPLLLCLTLASRGLRARMAALCGASALAALALSLALTAALRPEANPVSQLLSVPAQQLVRAYDAGVMTDGERAAFEGFVADPDALTVHPHLADRAKDGLDAERLDAGLSDFLALWARVGLENPRVYAEAFLLLNQGLWDPDDTSAAAVYHGTSETNDEIGYLQTNLYREPIYGFETVSLLPAVQDFLDRLLMDNGYQRLPLLPLLFCTATPFWALLFAAARLACRGRRRPLAALSGALGLWASYLFGPCTLARYVLPLFCLAPVALAAAFAPVPANGKELPA